MSKSFRSQINKIKQSIDNLQTETQRRTALTVYAAIVPATPVKSGRARSNWWMDVNNVATVIREPDGAASGTAQAITVSKRITKIDDTIFLSNNLPYIKRLNDGYSAQAAAGFVETAVQVGNARVKEHARSI